jgi:hypothetical protein
LRADSTGKMPVATFHSQVATFHSQVATFHSQVATFHSQVATFHSQVATFFTARWPLFSQPGGHFFPSQVATFFPARWPLFSQPGGHFFRNRASFQTTWPLCLEKLAMSWRTSWLSEGVARADRAGLANQRRQDAGAQFAWSERRQDAGASVRRDGTGLPRAWRWRGFAGATGSGHGVTGFRGQDARGHFFLGSGGVSRGGRGSAWLR